MDVNCFRQSLWVGSQRMRELTTSEKKASWLVEFEVGAW